MLVKIRGKWINPELVSHIFNDAGEIKAIVGSATVSLAFGDDSTVDEVVDEIGKTLMVIDAFARVGR